MGVLFGINKSARFLVINTKPVIFQVPVPVVGMIPYDGKGSFMAVLDPDIVHTLGRSDINKCYRFRRADLCICIFGIVNRDNCKMVGFAALQAFQGMGLIFCGNRGFWLKIVHCAEGLCFRIDYVSCNVFLAFRIIGSPVQGSRSTVYFTVYLQIIPHWRGRRVPLYRRGHEECKQHAGRNKS